VHHKVEAARRENKRRRRQDNRGDATTSKGEDMVEVVMIVWGIERRQDGNCATGWLLDGVKIVLLLFKCSYPEQSLPNKIN
jgi:hypothetical protein